LNAINVRHFLITLKRQVATMKSSAVYVRSVYNAIQEAELMPTNPRDAIRGQSRSLNTVSFDALDMVSY